MLRRSVAVGRRFQGVEAQTVANAYAAMEHDLEIIPVINKIDLTHQRADEVAEEMEHVLGLDATTAGRVSAKTGEGIQDLLDMIIERIPPPTGPRDTALQAMVFDSHYDEFRGAITYCRLMAGQVKKGDRVKFLRSNHVHEVQELGHFMPKQTPTGVLRAGQVGYMICNIKSLDAAHIGDTVSSVNNSAEPLPGYAQPNRMVYCGLYPSDGQDFSDLRDALTKLAINDPSFDFEPESSDALGFGFRCGFLGLLHMEIVQQRLEGEADIDLVQTAPNVSYQILKRNGETIEVHRPQEVPDPGDIEEFRQPIVRVNLIQPEEYVGAVMKMCQERRGIQLATEYLSATRIMLTYDLPLAEVIYDLHDKIKSATRGYGTMDYDFKGFEQADLVRVDILVNGNRIDALSIICDRGDSERRGRGCREKTQGRNQPAHV